MRPANRSYLLSALLVVYAFNFTERWTLGLVLQDIKVDLGLTDTQLGFMTGIASAVFYALAGIPIARWADRGDRVTIIGLMTALQSAAVIMMGWAGSFLQLLLVRIAVSVGEAGCVPPSQSLISDYYSRSERPRALARYLMGAPLSVVIGFFVAGWINQFYGWRTTFMVLGLPGLLVAALAWLTLREPRREAPSGANGVGEVAESACDRPNRAQISSTRQPNLRQVCVTLWRNATFVHLLFALSVTSFFFQGIWKWVPAFFIRSHGMETGELGTWLAIIHAACGLLGVYVGGELASRYAANNERLQLKSMAVVMIGFSVIMPAAYFAPNPYMTLGVMALANIPHAAIWGPLYAVVQTLVPARTRAISVAIIFLFSNLIGAGLGPLAAGALSDALRPMLGEESLRFALIVLCAGYLWIVWHLWRASGTVTRDLLAVQTDEDRASQEGKAMVAAPTHRPAAS